MIISATGLHGSGKSYLLRCLAKYLNVPYFHKRLTLQGMSPERDSIAWYQKQYNEFGAYRVLKNVLEFLPQYGDIIIFDAVHNPAELKALREYDAQVILVGVFCPDTIRSTRNGNEDPNLDINRITYWHEAVFNSESACLMSEVEWAFNGCMDPEIMDVSISHFNDYINTVKI